MGRSIQAVLKLAVVGVVATTGPVVMAATAEAHGSCRAPADVERVTRLSAVRTSCASARGVATAYDEKVMSGSSFPEGSTVRVKGFRCATVASGAPEEETFQVRCGSGRIVVRFNWGV